MQSTTIVEGFRLSPQQRRLWRLQQDATLDVLGFGSHLALLLEGELRSDALRDALQKVCGRHESLRTTFRRLPSVVMPVLSVDESLTPSWHMVDLSGTEEREQAARKEELLALESRRRFDYENGPLVHATLFVLSPGRHLLSVSLPALCADRRTLSNLSAELSKCYSEVVTGSEVGGEAFQYIQFSEWQNSLWEEGDASEGKEYWGRQDLSAGSAVLPGRHTRRRARSEIPGELKSVKLMLTPEYTAHAAALAKKYETTSATVLLSAWQTLLWRVTQESVVVGNVSDGRPYELLHDAFGLFARVLPVCCQLTDGLRFGEVIAQIDSFQHETEEWQDYFDLDQAAEGALKYFSFGYEYAELPLTRREEGGLQISVSRQYCYTERFDLKLTCAVMGAALELEFQYDSGLFREDDVRRLAGQFQTLLDVALADPEALVEELKIVSVAERQQILFEWNNTKRDYPLEQCLHQLFEQQVERTPDALAAVFQDRQLTFEELNRRANQLARHLQTRGVGQETPVGLCVLSSLEMLVGVLGILKAGGAYLPLDPRNPSQRLNQVLSDAGASVLLTQEHLSTGRFEASSQLISLDTDWEKMIAAESVENLRSQTAADNLAYIIYTSGSTGQPKGVMIQHRSVVNLAAALREEVYAGLGSALRVGLNAPLAFDASVKQLLQLCSGHTLYLLPEELRLDAVRAVAYFNEQALDVLDCTPSQLKLLLAAGLNQYARSGPKMMLIGGEALDESLWSRLAEDQRRRFYNVYGPTECTVDATWAPVTSAPQRPTIGRPIPNTEVYVLDKELEPVGIEIAGELSIGGTGVARGYLNRPERTAERFVPDGLSGKAGARLYRSGDLASYSPDGSINFIGRNDSQVKVRGHRIEPGEIEAVLRRHEKVQEAVVVVREDPSADMRLVGYVVAEGGETVEVGELRRMLSERLPEYMLPSFLVVLDELPLTRNGKVDLSALPAPEAVRQPPDEHYVAPRNEIEEAITRIWQEVLGVERIGVHDNFFDAGGHSLLMVHVHNKLSEAFGKDVSIVEMFAKPTISALAEYFSEANGHKPTFQKVMDRAARRKQAVSRRQS
jgi:amino acid adenylation domain-containing protein